MDLPIKNGGSVHWLAGCFLVPAEVDLPDPIELHRGFSDAWYRGGGDIPTFWALHGATMKRTEPTGGFQDPKDQPAGAG